MAGYERSVSPGGFTPLGDAPLSAFDGVGQAIGEVAGALKERQQDEDSVKAANALADAQIALNAQTPELRAANSGANVDGHVPAANAAFQQATGGILEGIRSPEVKRSVERQLAGLRGSYLEGEAGWAAGERVNWQVQGAQSAFDKLDMLATHSDSPNDWHGLVEQKRALLDGLVGVPASKREEIFQKEESKTYAGAMMALADRKPADAITMLDHGALDDMLDPAQAQAIREHAGVVSREQARVVSAAAQQRVAEYKQDTADQIALFEAGEGTPEQAQTIAARLQAVGDSDQAIRWRARANDATAQIGFRGAPPAKIDASLAALDEKVGRGEGLTPEEGSLRRGLLAEKQAQRGKTPLQLLERATNAATPPIDWNDVASVRARDAKARAAASTYGSYAPLLPGDLDALRLELGRGAAGRGDVAQKLAMFGGGAIAAARQVAPQDEGLRLAVAMRPQARQLYVRGADALSKFPTLKGDGKEVATKPEETFDAEFVPALRLMPDRQKAMQDAGLAIAAAARQAGGHADYATDAFRLGVQSAAGQWHDGKDWRGGFGDYGGHPVRLPDDMSAYELAWGLARSRAAGLAKIGGGAPVYRNGVAVPDKALARAIPVMRPDGRMALDLGGGVYALRPDGGQFAFDPHKLPMPPR